MKGTCNCCSFDTNVEEYKNRVNSSAHKLCKYCASSYISRAIETPDRFQSDEMILLFKSIAMVANILEQTIVKEINVLMDAKKV
jgi:hypothetical protein